MAQQTIITYSSAEYATMPDVHFADVHFDIREGKNFVEYLNRIFGEASYPDVHPDHLLVNFNRSRVQEVVNQIFGRALTDALTSRTEITDISANAFCRKNEKTGKMCVFFASAKLTTEATMDETAAKYALARSLDVDAANLAVERELTTLAYAHAQYCEAVVDIHPISKAWHDMKRDNPDRFYEIATAAYKHYGKKLWMGAWSEAHSEVENFLHWVMKNHPNIDLFTQEIGMNPDPAALPAAPTADPQQNNITTNQQNNNPIMAKTANTNIPAGYKVAPAAEGASQEEIAAQFATQFEKALAAISPSGKKLADCDQWWTATSRNGDPTPGRIITCKVVENEQTYHIFTFDCRDRHRDSTTYDEGMKFDWLSVDAMIKAFTGQASVLDCVKDACKKRLTGQTAAPKAQTKSAPQAAPLTPPNGGMTSPAEPEPQTTPQPTEATTPAPFPKAATKTAPAAPQSNEESVKSSVATPDTPSVFATYECAKTPSFYYHLYGEGDVSGIVTIHKQTGDVRQHSKNQTMDSSRAIIENNAMTEVTPIPSLVITALIKEGVIKTPMAVAPLTPPNGGMTSPAEPQPAEDASASAEAAAAEQREREEAERKEAERKEAEAKAAAEKAEQERIAKEQAEREAEEEAKRKAAEEEEAKRRAEEEKQKIAKRNATMLIRHRDYDKIRIEVELQPLTRTGNYFWGDAGTGKTHMAKQLADDLGLKFYYQGVVQMINDFKGLVDGHGRFHATAAYYAATRGGMLVLDEMDRYPEDALIWLNGLIANRYASFYVWDEELQCVSEQTITAHPDFRVVATGNTNGEGPTPLYTAAVQLDASTLDRFNFTHVDYDERVELAIAEGDAELVEFIEAFRATVRDCRFNNLVTYRAVETIHVYMKDGRISIKDALTDRIVKGMSTENQRFVANRLSDHVNTTRNKYAKAYCELANENYRSASNKAA